MDILLKAGEKLSNAKFDIWDIFYEDTETLVINFENKKLDQFSKGFLKGVGVRGVKNFEVFYNYTDKLNEKEIIKIIKNLNETKKTDNEKNKFFYVKTKENIKKPHNKIKTNIKLEMLKDLDYYIRKIDKKIKQVKLTISEKTQNVKILNDKLNYIEEKRVYTSLIIFIVAIKDDKIETGYSVISGKEGYELFDESNLKERCFNIAEATLRLLDVKEKITGKMTAIISAEAGGTLIHEAVGHSLEADLVQKGLSEYKGRIGEEVASSLITVIDDPTILKKRGSYFYDDEGIEAQKTTLIENGILKNYLYDRITALKDNCRSTGNGRRESFLFIPIPRMSNIYIKPGYGKKEDLIKDTKNGIFIKKMGGGQVNTVNGEFIFEIKEAFKIENGKITKPIRDATLLGKGPEILKTIDAVCDDLGFEPGTCGKDGQGVPVSDAQPTIRIPEILVGSK